MNKQFILVRRWVIAVALLCCCAWVTYCAGQSGWADFNALEAEQSINMRIRFGLPIDRSALEHAQASLEIAIAHNPGNGSAHENLSVVHRMIVGLPNLGFAERDQHLNAALAYALKAAEIRPTSGYAYSLVAVTKQMRGQRDAIFRKALAKAASFGPWEPGVQNNIIEAGSQGWETLDDATRDVVRQTVVRALQAYPEQAATFLLARRWMLPNCESLGVSIPGLCPGRGERAMATQQANP